MNVCMECNIFRDICNGELYEPVVRDGHINKACAHSIQTADNKPSTIQVVGFNKMFVAGRRRNWTRNRADRQSNEQIFAEALLATCDDRFEKLKAEKAELVEAYYA